MTKQDLITLISSDQLVTGSTYIINNATSTGQEVIEVTASSSSTICRNVKYINDNFDMVRYDISIDRLFCYNHICGVARNDGTNWQLVSGAHESIGIGSVENYGNGSMRVIYDRDDYSHVISMVMSPDETYAKNGINLGASAGVNDSTAWLYKGSSKQIGLAIAYHAPTGQWLKIGAGSPECTLSWASNKLLINHPVISEYNVSVSERTGSGHRVAIGSVQPGSTEIYFKHSSGNLITTPDANCQVFLWRESTVDQQLLNTETISNSNIWINGMMMKRI